MENNEVINVNIDYSPCSIKVCSFGNIINNEIELFISGANESKELSFLHYLTYDYISKDENEKKENTILFKTWNYTQSKEINYLIPINVISSEVQNNGLSNCAFIFDSKLELLLFNNNDFSTYLIDDEIYLKPNIGNELIYGLLSNIGLKIFDLQKKETKSILYPGKKHVINDYFISQESNNIIFTCEDKKIYVYDKKDGKSFISRPNKMEINLICQASNDGKKFYGYSDEDSSLYLYDIRNFNQFIDVLKQDIEITKMIYDKKYQKLFILEFGSEAIISIDDLKQESIYESKKQIKDFGFQKDEQMMNIISEDNSINMISI